MCGNVSSDGNGYINSNDEYGNSIDGNNVNTLYVLFSGINNDINIHSMMMIAIDIIIGDCSLYRSVKDFNANIVICLRLRLRLCLLSSSSSVLLLLLLLLLLVV